MEKRYTKVYSAHPFAYMAAVRKGSGGRRTKNGENFGAGVKILTMVSAERYTAYREEVIREQTTSSNGQITSLALDGGVGGVAF